MPLQATSGAASYDAFGGGVAAVPNYIEDVFSTWLIKPPADYTTYSINNGIDLSTKGGMTWFKARDAAQNNLVYDTARGSSLVAPNALITNSTPGQQTAFFDYVTPNTNGFTVNFAAGGGQLTNGGINYASWTFRKQPKFFDVVTYTGTGSPTTIAHSLGSVPACIIVKRTDVATNWSVYHKDLTSASYYVSLNLTNAQASAPTIWNSTAPTSTEFSIGTNAGVNGSGGTYVAYLFASNAGGFGLTGTDNVITCGTWTGTGSELDVTLGYEPQWIMIKPVSGVGAWNMFDVMRGCSLTGTSTLQANTSDAESSFSTPYVLYPTSTGFRVTSTSTAKFIYIAIRRGPMKVPTSGTSVFVPVLAATSAPVFRASFTLDSVISMERTGGSHYWGSRLTGTGILDTTSTAAEAAYSGEKWDYQTAMGNYTSAPEYAVGQCFQRAPSFFDEVCYTGTGSAQTLTHNLGVAPELMIIKARLYSGSDWAVYAGDPNQYLRLNTTNASAGASNTWNYLSPTSTQFSVGNSTLVGASGWTYVAYLFATCAGVSKVGSYTGNGSSQTINCGFTGGARFVMVKRTDSTGDWLVYDSARGIVSGNDPVLKLNNTDAESSFLDTVDTDSTGFIVNQNAFDANASGGTYIFLAIA